MKKIPLSQGKFALVDDDIYDYLMQWKWYASYHNAKSWYAVRTQWFPKKPIRMHQMIMGFPDGDIDHINGNGLDNQRENLRIVTHSQNLQNKDKQSNNTSGYKGVSLQGKRYRVRIKVGNKYIHIGYFDDIEEAAKSYDDAAKKYFGKFARLNFPK